MSAILGTRLRREREELGITQDALAKGVGLSSEFISLLELGKRMPSLETLTALADYFRKDVSYFLKEKEETFKIILRAEGLGEKARAEIKKFKKYCEEYMHLEELTGRHLEPGPIYAYVSPERMADEERRRMGFGDEPIRDIFSLLELNGLHILRQPIPEKSNISGIFIFFEVERAAFALINSVQTIGQQALIAAHEYCHYLKDRNAGPIIDNPDIFIDEYVSLYHPREKFAQTFAVRFLIHPAKVKKIIDKDFHSKKLSFADVLYLKRYFGVSALAMLRTLKDLEYLSRSKFEEYQKLDPSPYEEVFFGKLAEEDRLRKGTKGVVLSSRLKNLALEAYKKKKISAEKLSRFLKRDKNKIMSVLGK
ncbi:MAG: helix-turn-helix domain-containing protein [Candidatus Aminicenantes bacterium]|nr:MAG: helix-turn-helix domain-containing protein [Candidatus Aminicenantes bacterium]